MGTRAFPVLRRSVRKEWRSYSRADPRSGKALIRETWGRIRRGNGSGFKPCFAGGGNSEGPDSAYGPAALSIKTIFNKRSDRVGLSTSRLFFALCTCARTRLNLCRRRFGI